MFVTGCHRSGTSLLSSLMHGLVTGQTLQNVVGSGAEAGEPLGFFESKHLVEINDSLLHTGVSVGSSPPCLPVGTAPFSKRHNPIAAVSSLMPLVMLGDKDPRICITYPAYLHILLRRIPLIVLARSFGSGHFNACSQWL